VIQQARAVERVTLATLELNAQPTARAATPRASEPIASEPIVRLVMQPLTAGRATDSAIPAAKVAERVIPAIQQANAWVVT
jgi:hypothetical protein